MSVPTVHPPICPHVSAQFQLGEFSRNLIFGTFIEICHENSNLATIRQKISVTFCEDLCIFDCCQRHKFSVKSLFNGLIMYIETIVLFRSYYYLPLSNMFNV